jgi:hypothetical protein
VTISIYARKVHCDLCRVQADCPGQYKASEAWADGPVPDDWTALVPLHIRMTDFYGSPVSHLCPQCGAKTIAELVQAVRARFAADRAARS